MKNVICLLIDRLHLGYWGAYGNAEIETPTLDRLAAESFLADRFYVDTPDPIRQCNSWWRETHALAHEAAEQRRDEGDATPTIMARLNAAGYRTVLVTDDPAVAYSPEAGDFSETQLLPVSDNTAPCEEIEETHLCGMLAHLAATAESLAASGTPYCLWCHLRGFDEKWDFPLFLREKYCGEDDPEPYAGVAPPFLANACSDSSDGFDDFRQSVVSAYAGGVTMFGELLEMLTGSLRDGELGNETLFLLAGLRGALFGEHGIIGIPSINPVHDDAEPARTFTEPLASSLVQVPLVVRFPDGFGATVRSDVLLQPPDMTRLLCEWLELPQNTAQAGPDMLALIREEPQNQPDRLLIVASDGGTSGETANETSGCLVTPVWYLQEIAPEKDNPVNPDGGYALYVKPDDRWDVNDVSDRCVEIVEQLIEAKTDLHRRLIAGDVTPLEPLPDILRER